MKCRLFCHHGYRGCGDCDCIKEPTRFYVIRVNDYVGVIKYCEGHRPIREALHRTEISFSEYMVFSMLLT